MVQEPSFGLANRGLKDHMNINQDGSSAALMRLHRAMKNKRRTEPGSFQLSRKSNQLSLAVKPRLLD